MSTAEENMRPMQTLDDARNARDWPVFEGVLGEQHLIKTYDQPVYDVKADNGDVLVRL